MTSQKNPHTDSHVEPQLNEEAIQACDDYVKYLRLILEPAMMQLEKDMDDRNLRLHQVFGANLFLAHAVDYILKIRVSAGLAGDRKRFVTQFDTLYSVDGARFSNRKFELVDAINNALKHIRLEPTRYKKLEEQYGAISFQSLVEDRGDVMCLLEGYRFDYARVVLRPAWDSLNSWHFEGAEDVFAFACESEGQWSQAETFTADDWNDPIDQMVDALNPTCEDCGEHADECRCSQYVYRGQEGEFVPRRDESFDFDEVMSRISGAYRRERD